MDCVERRFEGLSQGRCDCCASNIDRSCVNGALSFGLIECENGFILKMLTHFLDDQVSLKNDKESFCFFIARCCCFSFYS